MPMRRCAASMASMAWPSDTPGARLNDSVTHGNCPWWLTDSGSVPGVARAMARSGTMPDAPRTYTRSSDSGPRCIDGGTSRITR